VIPLACKMLYSIGPKTGIGFRKARCVDSTTWSVLCASEWTHGALTLVWHPRSMASRT
jgi:hypothetical protein